MVTDKEKAMKEKVQLKNKAFESLKFVEQWYNTRKSKAMRNYMSPRQIKTLENTIKDKVKAAR